MKPRTYHGGKGRSDGLYQRWHAMLRRCRDPKHSQYKYYGARGITVCERWRNDFGAFLADMGPPPGPQYSLDRIDNDGNYEPGNVRWATPTEQVHNRRPCAHQPVSPLTKFLTAHGVTDSIAGWARRLGVERSAIRYRIRQGWDMDRVLGKPFKRQKYKPHARAAAKDQANA